MIIQHNLPSMNSNRQLALNNSSAAKNLEKLSSGFKINRAGDDAAGLAISEKMRGQIRGLAMASQNAQNGVSLIQTAEGGLNETHSILQRMRELAVQSANGTYGDEVDRVNIAKEVEALKSEIDRIASSTHYNNISLLNGKLSDMVKGKSTIKTDPTRVVSDVKLDSSVTHGTDFELEIAAAAYDSGLSSSEGTPPVSDYSIFVEGIPAANDIVRFKLNINGTIKTYTTAPLGIAGADATVVAAAIQNTLFPGDLPPGFTVTATDNRIIFTSANDGEPAIKLVELARTSVEGGFSNLYFSTNNETDGTAPGTVSGKPSLDGSQIKVNGVALNADNVKYNDESGVFEIAYNGSTFSIGAEKLGNALQKGDFKTTIEARGGEPLIFQIGANSGADQTVSLKIYPTDSGNIGVMSDNRVVSGSSVKDISVNTLQNANNAIAIIDAATNWVSGQRADLGALQNRLEHTLNNLGTAHENLTAAESAIRDVDMTKGMMEFTKNNILLQASQSMLAQANQLPQGVMQLLR